MKARLLRVLLILSILVFLVGCPGLFEKPLTLSIPDQGVFQGDTLVIELLDHVSGGRGTLVFTIEEGVGEIDGSTYTYTPGYDVFDNQTVKIRVKDDRDESVEDTFVITVEAFEVEFEDENLEAVVREAINKPEGPIYKSDVIDLQELNANGRGITSVEGIQHLESLVVLEIGRDYDNNTINDVQDISPLAGLENLQGLNLSDNPIVGFSVLENLTNLRALNLNDSGIADLSVISGLRDLKTLWLRYNGIADISPLAHLEKLEILGLRGNELDDISALSSLVGLWYLVISENDIDDITALENLSSLRVLMCWDTQLSDIGSLSSLTNLQRLDLFRNSISDLSPLSGLTSLEYLYIGSNLIEDVTPISGLTNLIELSLYNNRIVDISALKNLSGLRILWINDNQIVDIGELAHLQELQYLNIEDNQISDISILPFLPNLWGVSAGRNPIVSLIPFHTMTNLVNLALVGLYLQDADVDFLSNLVNLSELWLNSNNLTSLSPTENLDLVFLDANYNELSDISALVANTHIGEETWIDLRYNFLNLAADSQDMIDIQTLLDRGVEVLYEPQREPGESAGAYTDYYKDECFGDSFCLDEKAYRWEMYPLE